MIRKLIVLVFLVVSAVAGASAQAEDIPLAQLSRDDVVRIFISHRWNGPDGTFFFDGEKGEYTYIGGRSGKKFGPWKYSLEPDGVIDGNTTKYTFYREVDRPNKYHYYHSYSGKYYKALPLDE